MRELENFGKVAFYDCHCRHLFFTPQPHLSELEKKGSLTDNKKNIPHPTNTAEMLNDLGQTLMGGTGVNEASISTWACRAYFCAA